MTRTVDTDLQVITDMLRNFTGLQIAYRLAPNQVVGPILYTLSFRTVNTDPGDNHTLVGATTLAVDIVAKRIHQYSAGRRLHDELAQLVDQCVAVYYDNLQE